MLCLLGMTSENVLSADNQQERLRMLHPWYVAGLVDGEGSFHIALSKDERMRSNIKVIPELHVSQNECSKHVLEALQSFFSCGYVKVNHRNRESDQTFVYVVRNRNDLLEKIIPFFQKHQLHTTKEQDFNLFAQIVSMMNNGLHQTTEGVIRIIKLAYQMNNKAKRRKVPMDNLIAFAESSETIRGTSQSFDCVKI